MMYKDMNKGKLKNQKITMRGNYKPVDHNANNNKDNVYRKVTKENGNKSNQSSK